MDEELIFEAFFIGVDYGLLLAEEERDSEDLSDAFNCMNVSKKQCMPSQVLPRRMPRNEEWREAKRDPLKKLNKLIKFKFQQMKAQTKPQEASVSLKEWERKISKALIELKTPNKTYDQVFTEINKELKPQSKANVARFDKIIRRMRNQTYCIERAQRGEKLNSEELQILEGLF